MGVVATPEGPMSPLPAYRLRDEASQEDRVTRIRVSGLRSLRDIDLSLEGLTVLIGENGTGKSSIVEAVQLLREVTTTAFFQQFNELHGGGPALLRKGDSRLTLGVEIEGAQAPCRYDLSLAVSGHGLGVDRETVRVIPRHSPPSHEDVKLSREGSEAHYYDLVAGKPKTVPADWSSPILPRLGANPLQLDLSRVLLALEKIDVHVPFDVVPRWVARALSRQSAARESVTVQPAESLQLLARNLPNAYHELKNHIRIPWSDTLDLVRLGLGYDVEDVMVRSDAAAGQISLALKYRSLPELIPMFWLSDGTLSYLAFVALAQLSPPGGLLVFDEPELHLHPALIDRVVGLFEELSLRRPVLIATQSDRFLDALTSPADSVVLCELDEDRSTRLSRPDAQALGRWLEQYRGLGSIRAAGHERSVFPR